jgi:DNA-binding NarL/FixJ family response regulator
MHVDHSRSMLKAKDKRIKCFMVRVMIVSSYKEVREGLCKVLQLAGGIEITGTAANLDAFIKSAGWGCPDVALVDLEMADAEGYETIQQIKRLCPRTPTIALTAHDYPAAKERALEAGAFSVMVKGLDVSAMVAAIQAATGIIRN